MSQPNLKSVESLWGHASCLFWQQREPWVSTSAQLSDGYTETTHRSCWEAERSDLEGDWKQMFSFIVSPNVTNQKQVSSVARSPVFNGGDNVTYSSPLLTSDIAAALMAPSCTRGCEKSSRILDKYLQWQGEKQRRGKCSRQICLVL